MSGPARCSLRTARSRTGENCWETLLPSRPCWTASSITATCSSAARGAGAPKPPPPMQQVTNDFAARGLRPCDPPKTKSKPFYEGKTEESRALPLVGTEGLRFTAGLWKRLAKTGYERVKLNHVLGAARWPVLRWPRRFVGRPPSAAAGPPAGFRISTLEYGPLTVTALGAQSRSLVRSG